MNGDIPTKPAPSRDKAEFLKEQLTRPKGDSKKWRMAKIGLWGIGSIFVLGVVVFLFQPAAAGNIVLLCQTAIGAWTGIVGIYLGAQGSVDFKTTQALNNTVERVEKDVTIEHIYTEGDGGPRTRPWSMTQEGEDANDNA